MVTTAARPRPDPPLPSLGMHNLIWFYGQLRELQDRALAEASGPERCDRADAGGTDDVAEIDLR